MPSPRNQAQPTLLIHPASINEPILDSITTHLLLFAPTIYLNGRAYPSDLAAEARLMDLARAGLVSPWAYPGEGDRFDLPAWTNFQAIRELDERDYLDVSSAVAETVGEYRRKRGLTASARPIELVQISTSAWSCLLGECLGTDRVLAPKRESPTLISALRAAGYQQDVAQEFLSLKIGTGSLADLNLEDIVELQARYLPSIEKWLSSNISAAGAELGSPAIFQRSIDQLIESYETEVQERISRRRQRATRRAGNIAIGIAGIFWWPLSLVGVGSEAREWWLDRRDFKVQLFVNDIRTRLSAPGVDR